MKEDIVKELENVLTKVVKYYNESDICNFKIEYVNNGLGLVEEYWTIKFKDIHNPVGFYEFLFNPVYKTFEVFKVKIGFLMTRVSLSNHEPDIVKTPKEVINYLGNKIEEWNVNI
jgi:hypothetical protein